MKIIFGFLLTYIFLITSSCSPANFRKSTQTVIAPTTASTTSVSQPKETIPITPAPSQIPSQSIIPTAVYTATPILQARPTITIQVSTSGWKTYTSQDFHVSLKYPGYWQIDNTGDAVLSGPDDFFQITANALMSPDAKAACEMEIQNNMGKEGNLYGSKPTLEILQVDNQPACLVYPSDDQPESDRRSSLLIVEYPNSVREHALLYLWADKDHIRNFIKTLKFIR